MLDLSRILRRDTGTTTAPQDYWIEVEEQGDGPHAWRLVDSYPVTFEGTAEELATALAETTRTGNRVQVIPTVDGVATTVDGPAVVRDGTAASTPARRLNPAA